MRARATGGWVDGDEDDQDDQDEEGAAEKEEANAGQMPNGRYNYKRLDDRLAASR